MGVELTWLREADKMYSPTDDLLIISIILDLETFATNLLFFTILRLFQYFLGVTFQLQVLYECHKNSTEASS